MSEWLEEKAAALFQNGAEGAEDFELGVVIEFWRTLLEAKQVPSGALVSAGGWAMLMGIVPPWVFPMRW